MNPSFILAVKDKIQAFFRRHGNENLLDKEKKLEIGENNINQMLKSRSLLNAVANDDLEQIRVLMNNGDYYMDERDESGMNSIHLAALNGKYEIACQLLTDATFINSTCDHLYEGCTALHLAAYQGYENIVQLLAIRGAHINARNGSRGLTALHEAARKGNVAVIERLLNNGADIRATDMWGHSALHYGVKNTAVIRYLLLRGCDVNFLNQYKESALYYAALKGSMDAVKLLLESGADVDNFDILGETVLMMLAKHSPRIRMMKLLWDYKPKMLIRPRDSKTLLHLAVYRGSANLIDFLLVDADVKIDALSQSGATAFQLACKHKNVDAIRRLLDYNCNIDIGAQHIISILMKEQNRCGKMMCALLVKHCERLAAMGRTWSSHYAVLFSSDKYERLSRTFKQLCTAELRYMKKMKVGDSFITYHDVLFGSVDRAAACLRHTGNVLHDEDLSSILPLYGTMVECKLRLAYKRMSVINDFIINCEEPAVLCSLPTVCVDIVLKYLTNTDLENLIYSVSFVESSENMYGRL